MCPAHENTAGSNGKAPSLSQISEKKNSSIHLQAPILPLADIRWQLIKSRIISRHRSEWEARYLQIWPCRYRIRARTVRAGLTPGAAELDVSRASPRLKDVRLVFQSQVEGEQPGAAARRRLPRRRCCKGFERPRRVPRAHQRIDACKKEKAVRASRHTVAMHE